MSNGFFKIRQQDDATEVSCAFCSRIRWAGLTANLPKSVAVCPCPGSMAHAAEVAKTNPPTFDVENPEP